ncbi:YhcN/YlaJ family sporulation lipoprotein [Cytobacillus purgationiresistens]|uniref:Spore cortex protein n=1 Tax=Cytobacillus purgationiresistens TaxID=863449 RepID=A0ABU0AGP4_9BACI|nr:YhcN/YlaJ family sporulation lipoprotein [Cytobacillus purgationiresistens]MDQ0269886.1 spore cortex protein [Cytobacillus purgationiresistens]
MNRKMMAIPFAVLATLSLTACGNNNDSTEQNHETKMTQPIGYYSNENHDHHNGKTRLMNDDDGPVTEILDHSLGGERAMGNDGRFSRSDENYHGHIVHTNPTRTSYYGAYDGRLIEKATNAAEQVDNVEKAAAVEHDNKVAIGILLADQSQAEASKEAVYNKVKPLLQNKKVKIITNQSEYYNLTVIDNNLRAGEQMNENLDGLFQ